LGCSTKHKKYNYNKRADAPSPAKRSGPAPHDSLRKKKKKKKGFKKKKKKKKKKNGGQAYTELRD